MKLNLLLNLVTLLLFARIQAQTLDVVTIPTLNKNNITTAAYPFDVPFYIKGKVPDNCTRIIFQYKVSDKEKDASDRFKKWISLPTRKNVGDFFTSDDKDFRPADGDFMLLCRGVHPNLRYSFLFGVIKEPLTDEKLKTEIKKKIAGKLLEFINTFSETGFRDADITTLNNDLTRIITESLITDPARQKLQRKNNVNAPYAVNLRQDLNNEFNVFAAQGIKIQDAADALYKPDGFVHDVVTEFTAITREGAPAPFGREITDVLAARVPLSDNTKALLDINITPALESFKGYTLRNGLLVLKKISQSPVLLEGILKGNKKIANNDVVNSATLDVESIVFLNALINFLQEGNLTTTQAAPNNILFRQLNTLRTFFDQVVARVMKLTEAKAKIATFTANLPDLTAALLIRESITQETIVVPDVMTQNTPYISVEGGIGYGSAFEAAFSYYGANFYFSPVNKKARLSTFKGWNLIKKMICVNLGIANQFGDRPLNTYSILGSGTSDLYLGLGVRLGRIVKLNVSGIPYKVSNNPLTNHKELKLQFFAGIGADVNLLGALGTLGKTLRITQ